MSGTEHASALLQVANKDLKSLRFMLNPAEHDDEIFGFHAQQAIEKALKAWIAHLGEKYALTHDLSALLQQLDDCGQDVEPFWDLVECTIYGVQYRYEALSEMDNALDRASLVSKVEALLTSVAAILTRST